MQPLSVSATVAKQLSILSSLLTVGNFAETATAAMNVSKATGSSAALTNAKPVDVQTLMKSDPRFIARLIQQLDSQMHDMQDEKKRRQQAMKEDTEEMQRIDQEIKTHIQPGIVEYFTIQHFLAYIRLHVCLK